MIKMENVIPIKNKSNKQPTEAMSQEFIAKGGTDRLYPIFASPKMGYAEARNRAEMSFGEALVPQGVFKGVVSKNGIIRNDNLVVEKMKSISKSYVLKMQNRNKISKTVNSGDVGGMIPEFVAPEVYDVAMQRTPFKALVTHKMMDSNKLSVPVREASKVGSITFSTDDGGDLTAIDQAYTEVDVVAKLLFVPGAVTHYAMKSVSKQIDLYKVVMDNHYTDLQTFKESVMLRGNNGTDDDTWDYLNLANGYNGLVKTLKDYDTAKSTNQLITLSGQAISIAHFESIAENIRAHNGEVSAYVCDQSTFSSLRTLSINFKRFSEADINIGFPDLRFSYNGVPVFATNSLNRTSGIKSLIGFDVRAVEYYELQPDMLVIVADRMSPQKEFYFEHFGDFIVKSPLQCSAVIGGT